MSCATSVFGRNIPFQTVIKGTVGGQRFTVEGTGTGDATVGKMNGKFTCTSGKLPISWAAMASTLGYGYKCFASYPGGLTHFFQETMPEGYTQERATEFPGDGTLKAVHEITLEQGIVMNRITVTGDGFKPNSPVLNDGIKVMLPMSDRSIPADGGIQSFAHPVFPLKAGGYVVARQTTVNKARVHQCAVPGPHYTHSHIQQSKDAADSSDHIVQDEAIEAQHEWNLL